MARTDAVAAFANNDVTWLDELRALAQRMPDADHVKLTEVILGTERKQGGVMTLKGHVKRADVIAEFEDSLRDKGHIVSGKSGLVDNSQRDYPYELDTGIGVEPDKYDRGRSQGRPDREELRKQVAAAQSTPAKTVKTERPPETKEDPPPEAKPEDAPAPKPADGPTAKPENEPASKPVTEADAAPENVPAAQPKTAPEAKPQPAPAAEPAAAPAASPEPAAEPPKTEASPPEMNKVDDQPTKPTGSDQS